MRLTPYEYIRSLVPKPIKAVLRPVLGLFIDKYGSELGYWRNRHRLDGFENEWYRPSLLGLAGEENEAFLLGKVVADFGCGPNGSLAWLGNPHLFGIDVLADKYAEAFPDDIRSHGMIYVTCTETVIPMPSNSIDVMFTRNALDHTSNLEAMCSEIVRVIKTGGELIGGFNLYEPATYAEPQTLTPELLGRLLFRHFSEVRRVVDGGHLAFRGTKL